ncbi:MAG TPA: acyl-CoA dehydrogenase [Blastocatellia bacterium]|nr:acyl-CoA dehydrogenase [Blastocatellia bacterium]HMV83401.1 acyl-CoA dehydrogenase [Blastocatellia bacterium]HMY74171.1 acyl-CoA dehydrogenase [Blastocatellia bacterium]HMZ18575.1 acyl-CoA dehydrogenase [Blastocatellia bacterium]HNG28124.1 acyl-CoA dehydrogenase [Blastocatellia bacterium]
MAQTQPALEQEAAQPLTVLSEEERLFAASVREFAEAEIKPYVREMDEKQKMRPEIISKCFELGLMGIEPGDEYGGSGGSFFMACLAIEELARVDASISVMVDVNNTLTINAFLNYGNEALRKKYITRLATDTVGAYCLSEAGSGSDAFALQTRAEDKGDHYLLNGRKMWITNGNEAGIFIVFANLDPSKGYKGITAFVVEKDFEGFTVGKKEDKLGIRASSTCELLFDNCRVPKDNVLGEVGKGYKIAIETLNEGRIGIGAQMLGLAQAAYEAALGYTKERKQFGQAISEFQGVQFQLAEMAVKIEAARLMVYNAARLKDARQSFIKQAAMAKLFASEVAEEVASLAVNLFGGYGYVKDYPVEKYFRDCKIGQIYEGTSNMQKQTIAKMLLAE